MPRLLNIHLRKLTMLLKLLDRKEEVHRKSCMLSLAFLKIGLMNYSDRVEETRRCDMEDGVHL